MAVVSAPGKNAAVLLSLTSRRPAPCLQGDYLARKSMREVPMAAPAVQFVTGGSEAAAPSTTRERAASSLKLRPSACMATAMMLPLRQLRRRVLRRAREKGFTVVEEPPTAGAKGVAVAEKPPPASQRRRSRSRTRQNSASKAPSESTSAAGRTSRETKSDGPFPSHLRSFEVNAGLRTGKFIQGTLRMNKNSCFCGIVRKDGEDFLISGSMALNRAVDGDFVVIEPLSDMQAESYANIARRLRHQVGKGPTVSEAEEVEQALQASNEAFRSRSGTAMARVVAVLKRTQRELVGSLVQPSSGEGEEQKDEAVQEMQAGDRLFTPADRRFPQMLVEIPKDEKDRQDLEEIRIAVVVTIWDRQSQFPRCRWSRVLGKTGDREVETEMMLMEHQVKNEPFTEEVLECLPSADFVPGPKDLAGREDFRSVCVFSIDPPGCEDVDDALSCEPLENGNYRLGVHIADVTHFVEAGSELDREAADRCTSVYMVDRRIDMLPRLLTTDICSLRCDGKDRLTFSVIFEITPDAQVLSSRFCKAVIRSRAALSYREAQERLDSDPAEDNTEITNAIRALNALAVQLRAARVEAGALELESGELSFELDGETQLPTNVFQYQSYATNKLIEEFMLLANRAAANEISDKWPGLSLLRRHPPPKEVAMQDLKELLEAYGFNGLAWETNKKLQVALNKVSNKSDPFFNKLVRIMSTRCMEKALYFCTGTLPKEEWAHYGLAMATYTHFTSPIRRYADCVVHRFLADTIGIQPLPGHLQDRSLLMDGAEKLNFRHTNAQDCDRASNNFNLYLYFKNTGAVVAEGVVMRVTKSGISVAVEEYGAEGVAELSEKNWLAILENQSMVGRPRTKFQGLKISIFNRVVVRIEANEEDGTYRRLKMTFLGMPNRLPDGSLAPTPAASSRAEPQDAEDSSESQGIENSS